MYDLDLVEERRHFILENSFEINMLKQFQNLCLGTLFADSMEDLCNHSFLVSYSVGFAML